MGGSIPPNLSVLLGPKRAQKPGYFRIWGQKDTKNDHFTYTWSISQNRAKSTERLGRKKSTERLGGFWQNPLENHIETVEFRGHFLPISRYFLAKNRTFLGFFPKEIRGPGGPPFGPFLGPFLGSKKGAKKRA